MERASRRRLLTYLLGAGAIGALAGYTARGMGRGKNPMGGAGGAALDPRLAEMERDNFRAIYRDPKLRQRFHSFLINVFNLYPDAAMQALITTAANQSGGDREAYLRVAQGLPEIEPVFGALRYALPALRKQRSVIAAQTVQLLDGRTHFEGYLEIGSDGRYLSGLKEHLEIEGAVFTSSAAAPGYDIEAIIDRGQLAKVGMHVPMNDYRPFSAKLLPAKSLQLVTVYIGFHHVPLELRVPYIESIRDAMADGATLVLRDHDVTSPEMQHIVALAHDVFNVGTHQPWSANEQELRHFYPLEFVVGLLEQHGFVARPGRLLQDGDPTRNTLLAFVKA